MEWPRRLGVRSQVNPCEIAGGQSGTVTGSSPSTSVSPVSTIPPMLHTHSFTYHPRYVIFLSQDFSFPLSVSFHQCSIPIFFLDATLISRTSGRSLRTFTAVLYRMSGRRWIEEHCLFFQVRNIMRDNGGSEYYCVRIRKLRTRYWWSVARSGHFTPSK